ncbi:sulfite exporter TauE/SafE family protein [Patiriisocius hiemis]|uniref:Probable membrane transporter protein n=1 Tax=Patiriisocius hiemis TaxID=3075604 RepID=A0ABU2YA71_9FLAO|nr:sulfite exporter TauE/SafE family protein [Constantimarinum sp. W242]MDT0554685.1 sulfite exporter TauE/SafE family protein [Constantimarinum sp. W242]
MLEIFFETPLWLFAVLFFLGAAAFTLSTISGGGGALMQIPILNFLIGTSQTAQVINLGTFISRPSRIILFWKHINWKIFWYYVPSAMLGAIVAGYLFSEVRIVWIQVIVGLFLVSTFFQYHFGKKERSFNVSYWFFIPLGFFIAVIGTFTGGMGPILNPFLLNAGIEKEELIGTKAAQAFSLGIAQISSYTFFGLLTPKLIAFGVATGLGATLGNFFGKILLKRMSKLAFRKWVIAIMVISGIVLIVRAVSNL